ncbi:MAG: hypothetical protein ACLU37_01990 [Collinsella sp.]
MTISHLAEKPRTHCCPPRTICSLANKKADELTIRKLMWATRP